MAADNGNVQITLSADDQATAKINDLTESLNTASESTRQFTTINQAQQQTSKELTASLEAQITADQQAKNSTQELSTATQELTGAHQSLVGQITQGVIAANLIGQAWNAVTGFMKESVAAATEEQQAMQGVVTVGTEMGQNAGQIQQAVQSLTQNGLMTTTQAATALRNVMQTGLGVDQATQAVSGLETIGSLGRKTMDDLGTSTVNATVGFRNLRSITLENQGVMGTAQEAEKQYAAQQGVSTQALDQHAKYLAEYNTIVNQAAGETGNLGAYAQTAAGQQAIFTNETIKAQESLGDALLPAVTALRGGLTGALIPAVGDTEKSLDSLQQFFLTLALEVTEAANVVVGFGRELGAVISGFATGDFSGMATAWNETTQQMGASWNKYLGDMQTAAQGGFDTVKAGSSSLANQETQDLNTATQHMLQQEADLTQSFKEQQAARLESFNESLTQMILAHENKVDTVKQQMADEQSSYDEAVTQRAQNYSDQVASIEDAHNQKVSDLQEQLSTEQARRVEKDGVVYAVADQAKIEKLQDSLEKENAAYDAHLAKIKTQYDQQVKAAQESHDKKFAALQTELDKENAILQAHASDVAKVGQQTAEDDISRLQRKYTEQNTIDDQHYADQLAKIRRSGAEQGAGLIQNYAAAAQDQANKSSGSLFQAGETLGGSFTAGLGDAVIRGSKSLMDNLNSGGLGASALNNKKPSTPSDLFKGMAATIPIALFGPILGGGIDKLFGFAEGGTISRPTILSDMATGQPYGMMAESGPEDIVPRGGKGVTVNQTNHIYYPMDADALKEQMGFDLAMRL